MTVLDFIAGVTGMVVVFVLLSKAGSPKTFPELGPKARQLAALGTAGLASIVFMFSWAALWAIPVSIWDAVFLFVGYLIGWARVSRKPIEHSKDCEHYEPKE